MEIFQVLGLLQFGGAFVRKEGKDEQEEKGGEVKEEAVKSAKEILQ